MARDDPPKVTGLAPNAGPPGCKITIRGENLGQGPRDLIGLTICGKDCLLSAEWKSPAKIICRSGPGVGKGEVIVTTSIGGVGSCTVQFRGFMEIIGPVKESAVWVDESILINPVFGRKRATSPSQLHPDDPLELYDERNEEKFPEDELMEMFPDGSGDLRMENFVPSWFLLENHNKTSFEDLKSGLNCLKRKGSLRKEGPLSFLKANVQPVMDCLDTLARLNKTIDSNHEASIEQMTNKLETSIDKSKSSANSLFEEVLKRKDHADSTRNALNVMQRFKFLFHLPCSIERNIQKGDYGVVINDYARVKSVFSDTQVQIFKKVYKEVEEKIEGLRGLLLDKLRSLPSNLEKQKKIIKYLTDLEVNGDPAWECIEHQYNWIGEMLQKCRDSYLDQVKAESEIHEENLSTPRKQRKNSYFSKGDEKIVIKPPIRIKFVTKISDVFAECFPDLWKLGQAYFTGELLFKEMSELPGRVNPLKQAAYNKMIVESLKFYCSLVRAALIPHTLNKLSSNEIRHYGIWPERTLESISSWLPQSLRSVRSCYSSLMRLNLPSDALDIMQNLTFDLRVHSMATLFQQAVDDVAGLHNKETWMLEIDDEKGGITQLPLLFENMVLEKLQLIKESVLQSGFREEELFAHTDVENMTKQMTSNLLTAFISSLEQLAFQDDARINSTAKKNGLNPPTNSNQNSNDKGFNIPLLEKRLLIILSNCNYTVLQVLPHLKDCYKKHNYPDVTFVIKQSISQFQTLDQKLFEAYIEKQSDPIIGAIEQNLYVGKFDWNRCPRPTDVRCYVKQVIMDIISVHSHVYGVSPVFINRVMNRIIELVTEEISRLYTCVPMFSVAGTLQARLDIVALQDVLSTYRTSSSGENIKESKACLPLLQDTKDKQLLEQLLDDFRNQMKFQLLCFHSNSNIKIF